VRIARTCRSLGIETGLAAYDAVPDSIARGWPIHVPSGRQPSSAST